MRPMGLDAVLENQLCHWPKFQADFQNAIFGYENWPLTKCSRSCTYTPFLPQGSKLNLFLLYGQWFEIYGPIFKIAIFRHETCPLAKVSKLAHTLLILPLSPKFHSIFSLWLAISKKTTQEKRLNSLLGGIQPAKPYFRVSLSAALIYEDTCVGRGEEEGLQCWSLARVMDAYKQMEKSVVDCATLPPHVDGATTRWMGCVGPPLGIVRHCREEFTEGHGDLAPSAHKRAHPHRRFGPVRWRPLLFLYKGMPRMRTW